MSKFTSIRDTITIELGSWLIRKLIGKVEDYYGREPTSGSPNPDRASSDAPKDGADGETAGRAGSKS